MIKPVQNGRRCSLAFTLKLHHIPDEGQHPRNTDGEERDHTGTGSTVELQREWYESQPACVLSSPFPHLTARSPPPGEDPAEQLCTDENSGGQASNYTTQSASWSISVPSFTSFGTVATLTFTIKTTPHPPCSEGFPASSCLPCTLSHLRTSSAESYQVPIGKAAYLLL